MNQKRTKVFYGWWIVASCIPIALFTSGVIGMGFTAFFEPIVKEFGWSYTQVSIGASLRGMESSIFVPFTGYLADKFGPRKLLFTGAIITGLGMVILSRVNSLGMYYFSSVVVALGLGFCNQTVMLTAVVNWFRKNVGKAIGITTMGISLNGLMVMLVTFLVDKFDWRSVMLGLGITVWLVVIPLTLVIRHKPEQYGYLPDGAALPEINPASKTLQIQAGEVSASLSEALKSRTFWQLTIAAIFFGITANAFQLHIMPYYSSVGINRETSSLIISGGLILGAVGALGVGWLGDRINKKSTALICFSLVVLGLVTLAYITSGATAIIISHVILFNLGMQGTIVIRSALMREYFGRNRIGIIMGLSGGIGMIGGIVGPYVAGWAFDTMGSYRVIWLVFAGLSALSVALVATIRPPVKV
jgi:MFS transporter, OFA family, oxalate/formate antiporter